MSDTRISVLVTRPEAQAEGWIKAIEAVGWEAVSFPTLAIRPLSLTPEQKQMVLDLDQYQGVICISGNAAELGLSLLSDYWPQWPVRQDWYAVGPATAEVMADYQIRPRVPDQHHSEGLLGLATLQDVTDQRFLILKGRGGRDAIQQQLRDRGARVDELPLYERSIPDTPLDILSTWHKTARRHVIACSSGDGLKNFLAMVAGTTGGAAGELHAIPLVVVSERLAKYAHDQGFSQVLVARGASPQAIVTAISAGLEP